MMVCPGNLRASLSRRIGQCALLALAATIAGCGTTRWSDTARTATEQLLISDATDRAVSQIDCSALAGKNVFLETKFVVGTVDEKYLVSTLRQHMLASGCIIKDKAEDATFIVEVRSGAIGTNRNDLLFGLPATSLPSGGVFPVIPTTIPEIPLMKRTNQQGVCKVAVFAYDRLSGRPVWQSGTSQVASKAKDTWVFGTGPFQRGTIYEGTKFAGEHLQVPLAANAPADDKSEKPPDAVWVSHEILFSQPPQVAPHSAPQVADTAPASSSAPPSPFWPVLDPAAAARRGYSLPVEGALLPTVSPPGGAKTVGYFETPLAEPDHGTLPRFDAPAPGSPPAGAY